MNFCTFAYVKDFYPRPPRGGRRVFSVQRYRNFGISIHALREEGDGDCVRVDEVGCISIHALREEGDGWLSVRSSVTRISIHALREEGDSTTFTALCRTSKFLSTPSARRATRIAQHIKVLDCDFYPRPPRGGRLTHPCSLGCPSRFLSTPSARRATILQ